MDGLDELFGDADGHDASVKEQKSDEIPQQATTEPWISDPIGNSRIPKSLKSPIRPSAETIDQHFVAGHVDYRDWCPVCVMSRGREDAHPRQREEDDDDRTGLPIIAMDYNELNEDSEKPQKLLVGVDQATGNFFAHNVVAKGLTDDWICKKIVKDLEELGRSDVILKTDGEPAIKAIQNRIQALRHGRTVPRNPPAYNPQSNGPCEKAVQDVTSQLRSIKIALEYRLKVKVHDDSPIMQWALEHAVFLLNKLNVHKSDGMTSYERLTGRKWRRPIVEFSERVLAKMALRRRERGNVRKQKKKLTHRCTDAIWVGQDARTGEHIVVLDSGNAVKCRTIKRVPVESRWDPERALLIRATPRCPAPASRNPEKLESKVADEIEVDTRGAARDVDHEKPDDVAEDPVPREAHQDVRDFRITKQLLDKYGFTDDCAGCVHKALGHEDHRPHSQQCRKRIADLMMQDERDRDQVDAARRRKASAPADSRADADQKDGFKSEVRESETEVDKKNEPNTETQLDDDMSIPDLELESDVDMGDDAADDPLRDLKQSFDESDDEGDAEKDEPSSKRPRIANIMNLQTLVARDLAGITNPVREELVKSINQVQQIKRSSVVKEIIEKLEKVSQSKMPKIRDVKREILRQAPGMEVAEIYSPPRITKMANQLGMSGGWALDLTEIDEEDGKPWDFTDISKRKKALQRVEKDKPFMLIMSPMCGPFSKLQEVFNYPKMERSEVEAKISAAMEHLQFTVELCARQHAAGRLFLFEHPASASSWDTQVIQTLADVDGVHHVKFDFCMLGMETTDNQGRAAPAKKRTGVLTNSYAVANLLHGAQCRGEHWHMELVGGKAGPCQVYPDKFARLICEGIKKELDTVRWRNEMYEVFDIGTKFGQLMAMQEKIEKMAIPPEETPFEGIYDGFNFYDDVHDRYLDRDMAIKARKTEIEYFKEMGVYTKIKRETWMRPISTKWIDTNKGDEACPNYRARLVGRELNLSKQEGLFAATPPLESLRMILSICASNQYNMNPEDNFIVMSNDIKRAYFYAPVSRPMFIIIPDEDWEEGDECNVGQLNLSLYGTRDAAVNWTNTFTKHLVDIGFVVGSASPCNFFHSDKKISLTVHGDDFTSTGSEKDLKWLDGQLRARYQLKTDFLGPGVGHSSQIRVLNRVLTWDDDGITYEPDQRHAEIIMKALDVQKAVTTPGTRDDAGRAGGPNVDAQEPLHLPGPRESVGEDLHQIHLDAVKAEAPLQLKFDGDAEESPLLDKKDASVFRALAARANYLAQDRPDIQFAVKEVARRMATPRADDWVLLKRIARYLVGAPRGMLRFVWQADPGVIDAYVDADWAGCKKTCRSTSGGALMHGWHCVKTWSSTQATVALSSGESELYSLTKGASQAIGLMALAADLGIAVNAKMHTDASATLGIVQRQGLGKLRHIGVQYLWLQERVRDGTMVVKKVAGIDNPADLMTKHLAAVDIERHIEHLNFERHSDRASAAPRLGAVIAAEDEWIEDELTVTRIHSRPRMNRFTPLRVEAAPPVRTLTATRVTSGKFVDSGETFTVVDNWTSRSSAHACFSKPWTGTTQFWRRKDWKI